MLPSQAWVDVLTRYTHVTHGDSDIAILAVAIGNQEIPDRMIC